MLQVGPEGAGHFVKMVHNGIEYGDMQLICESYHLMKQALNMSNDEMGQVCVVSFDVMFVHCLYWLGLVLAQVNHVYITCFHCYISLLS